MLKRKVSLKSKLRFPIKAHKESTLNKKNAIRLIEYPLSKSITKKISCTSTKSSTTHLDGYFHWQLKNIFILLFTLKILPNSDVMVVKNLSLNYEAPPGLKSIDIPVKVTDNGSPPLSSTSILSFVAEDVNEPPTNITLIGESKIPENTTTDTHIAQFWANNPEGFKQDLTFYIEPPSNQFEVIKTHGPSANSFLSLKEELDYDHQKYYELKIRVEDNGTPPLSSSGYVRVSILPSDACVLGTRTCTENRTCTRQSKIEVNCTCSPGFEMKSNDCKPINECERRCSYCENLDDRAENCKAPCGPCANNGTCIDQHNNYTCKCEAGFTGTNCYINIDDCIGKSCNNGTCIDGINDHSCVCHDGYTGVDCTEEIDECAANPCYDNQNCTDLIASYKCSCNGLRTGTRCERESCAEENECSNEQICHSIDFATKEPSSSNYRCINNENLASLELLSTFAPLSGNDMFSWKVKFESFLKEEVKIPLAWIATDKGGDILSSDLTDLAIYEYHESSKRVKRSNQDTSTTNVTFYGVVQDTKILPSAVLLFSINNTCEINYSDCTDYNKQFKCKVCGYVSQAVLSLNRPTRLQSTDKQPEDPLWMDVLPVTAIVICGILLIVLGACIYKYKRNSNQWKRDRMDDEVYTTGKVSTKNTIEIMERRSRTWNEHDLDHYAGVINPMYGSDEDEVESTVVNTSYKKLNPDGTVRVRNEKSSNMFDNPMFGLNTDQLENENQKAIDDIFKEDDEFSGFTNPTFLTPESEF